MADIFREVDEDLRRENFARLWQKYGVFLVGAAVAVVVLTAAVVGWQRWQLAEREQTATAFQVAADHVANGRDAEAAAGFAEIAANGPAGYAMLAGFQQAALAAAQGGVDEALAIYDRIAGNSSVDRVYRDLAVLLGALRRADQGDPAELIGTLAPLTADGNAWRASALELTALLEQRRGDVEKARVIYEQLAEDPETIPSIRERAGAMASALGQR